MKRIMQVFTSVLALFGVTVLLAACGGGGNTATGGGVAPANMTEHEMSGYTFSTPADWGDVQRTYPDVDMYWIGENESGHYVDVNEMELLLDGDNSFKDTYNDYLKLWFDESEGAVENQNMKDFTVGDLPARAAKVEYVGGEDDSDNVSYLYRIVFATADEHMVEIDVHLSDTIDDAVAEAIRDSIKLSDTKFADKNVSDESIDKVEDAQADEKETMIEMDVSEKDSVESVSNETSEPAEEKSAK